MRNAAVTHTCCLLIICGTFSLFQANIAIAQTATPTVSPTPQLPTVTTSRVTYLDENTKVVYLNETSVGLYGTVNANGLLTTAWFEYGTSSSYGSTSSTQSVNGTTTQRIRIDISGLPPAGFGYSYSYKYRIAAQNSAGTSYGSRKSFNLKMPKFSSSTAITYGATNITSNSATLNGESNAISPSTWFEYDTISGKYSNEVDAVSSPNNYSASISGFLPETTYYYRMAGEDKDYVYYGEEKFFTTLSATATPVITPTPVCEVVSINISPKRLILQKGQSGEVSVTLEGVNCFPVGNIVTATVSKIGSKRISVSPISEITDEAGKTIFTITAKDKTGRVKVTFNIWNLKKSIIVKIKR